MATVVPTAVEVAFLRHLNWYAEDAWVHLLLLFHAEYVVDSGQDGDHAEQGL